MSKYFRMQEGWLTVGLLALLLFSVTLSIQQAQWSDGLSILTPITIIGLVTGIVMAKVRGVPRFLLDVLGLEIGMITVLISVASVMQGPGLVTIQDKVQNLVERTAAWISVAMRQDVSDDLVVFVLSLAVVAWVLAYSSAYFVFRSRQLWWALVPNGVALLINLSYSPINLNGYIVVFMFSALLLMIRFNLLMKEERWQRERVNYSPTLTWAFLWAGSAVSVFVALAMWFVPASAPNSTLYGVWERVNKPWVDFQNTMSKLWATVPGNQSFGGYASFSRQFTMGGALNLSDAIAMKVKADERLYWRAITYDQYTGSGWSNTAQSTFKIPELSSFLALEASQPLGSDDGKRRPITYTVEVVTPKDDILYAALRPVSFSSDSRLELSWRDIDEVYNIDSFYSGDNPRSSTEAPLELRTLISELNTIQQALRRSAPPEGTVEDVDARLATVAQENNIDLSARQRELLGRGIRVQIDVSPGPNYTIDLRATGQVPVYDDISSVHAPSELAGGDSYTATSLVSEATDDELRVATLDYPQWVRERYLSLPVSMDPAVRDLALNIVRNAGASNPLDEARAIEAHLRENYEYSTSIGQPPQGRDRVAWFLFENKKGYCEYYASAMIVMLRSLDIPARFAAGYAPGTYDTSSREFVVRESAAHAWPEVYFPGYGWIQFEPTPSQPAASREIEAAQVPTPFAEAAPEPSVTAALPDPARGLGDDEINPAPDEGGGGFFGFGGPGGGGWLWLGFAGLAAGLAAVLLVRRKPAIAANPGFYYSRMISMSRFLRLGPSSHQTPYEFSETLGREFPGTSGFARTISRAYVRERFSPRAADPSERQAAQRAWDSLRGRLMRSLPARQLRGLKRRRR
ncbi:MAG: transglutaminaseTgpA domain-containing protein [Chloroflexota bacterium]|nr:transglutaminaseTgpA domain-containing protein [Chloroflexota bacterium]